MSFLSGYIEQNPQETQRLVGLKSEIDFIHFLATLKLMLKALWYGSFTFSFSPRISDMEKVFAKKLGFCRYKRTKFLILDKVELSK